MCSTICVKPPFGKLSVPCFGHILLPPKRTESDEEDNVTNPFPGGAPGVPSPFQATSGGCVLASNERRQRSRYAYHLPPVVFPVTATKSMIVDAEQQLLRDIMDSKGSWPRRPSARESTESLESLRLFDEKGGQWKVVQDVLREPAECPRCLAPPQIGFFTLQGVSDGSTIQACGSCVHGMAGPTEQRLIGRYWRKVGQHLRSVSDWMDLMVAALVWLELHRDYENTPGDPREQWVEVRRLYRRFLHFGFLGPENAETLHFIVTGFQHSSATGNLWEIEAYRKKQFFTTPEERYLFQLLSPDVYWHLSDKGKHQVNTIWDATKGETSRIGPRTRVTITRLYRQAIDRKRGEDGI